MNTIQIENYGHPGSHPPAIITQDANNRFVTDVQITQWDYARTTLRNPALNLDGITVNADGSVTLNAGTNVNEFSNDNTLGGNSAIAVPTEQAVKGYVDGQVTTINAAIEAESVVRENAEAAITAAYEADDAAITAAYGAADAAITAAYTAADAAITTAYENADDVIEAAYIAGDAALQAAYIAADAVVTSAYQAADTVVTNAFIAADTVIKDDLASNVVSKGASLVGIQDPNNKYVGTQVEAALMEAYDNYKADHIEAVTTANLTSAVHSINTTDKRLGRVVVNTDTGLMLYAKGGLATDVWHTFADVLAHTPV